MLQIANLALKFFLELCAVASIGYWAYQASDQLPLRVLFGLAAAAIFVVGWGVFLAPTANSGLTPVHKDVIGGVVLLVAAAALAAAGQRIPALIYAVAIAVNAVLLFALRRGPVPSVFDGARG